MTEDERAHVQAIKTWVLVQRRMHADLAEKHPELFKLLQDNDIMRRIYDNMDWLIDAVEKQDVELQRRRRRRP